MSTLCRGARERTMAMMARIPNPKKCIPMQYPLKYLMGESSYDDSQETDKETNVNCAPIVPKSAQVVSTCPGTGLDSFVLSTCPLLINIPILLEFHGTNVSTMYASFQNY